MILLLSALILISITGVAALMLNARPRAATVIGIFPTIAVAGCVVGCVAGLIPAIGVLSGRGSLAFDLPWAVPYASFNLELDPLSAWFLVPIFLLSALAAVYGEGYLKPEYGKRAVGSSWFFYNMLVVSMALVVLARNAVLFLVAWEVMSLASFFLVTFEDEKQGVRRAGWTYLVATHIGTAFLLALFVLMGNGASTLDFANFSVGPALAGMCFVLALIGFGTKAGLVPMHVWLPEAHPAAPSHVSALMSGVMIKTGVYGLLRTLMLLHATQAWWAWLMIGAGIVSGILGVLFALGQHDLKRLLAYHSVENIGIIVLGLGIGLLGVQIGSPALATLGFAGGLLHVVNHAMFKGLLFLGAGSVLHATDTREMDHLGGLLKRMPWTGTTFLIAAAAISGLPPLNGFVSEFLIYMGCYRGGLLGDPLVAGACFAGVAALALIGGLAAACFLKAFGIVFLGEPRSEHAAHAHEAPSSMRWPQVILAATCIGIAFASPWLVQAMQPVLAQVSGVGAESISVEVHSAGAILTKVVACTAGLLALILTLALLRRVLLCRRTVGKTVTWDCGYIAPTPRMQYTASSFAQPITDLFGALLGTRKHLRAPKEYFPPEASFSTETPDAFSHGFYRPAYDWMHRIAARLRWVQHGSVHLYVLYIAITLIVLLVWKLG